MLCYVMLCYVTWNLFTVGSLQFCNDSTIASLEANQNRNRTAPFVFHNLYNLKPPSKYSLRTGNLLSIPLKRTKFD